MKRNYSALPPFGLAAAGCLLAAYFAIFRPQYLNSRYLSGFIFLQVLIVALWRYAERFFPLLMFVFLWAGTAFPLQSEWTTGRWFVLAVAAAAGSAAYSRRRTHQFHTLHLFALFCVLSAVVSALVSSHPKQALLKALSLLLLFLYASSGARLSIADRAEKFFPGLLLACEILVYVTALAYFAFHLEVFGNRNSLGAVMGVVVVPVLLWGLVVSEPKVRQRRMIALLVALFLLFFSLARASIVAGPAVCLIFCISLRRYRLVAGGLAVMLIFAVCAGMLAPRETAEPDSTASLLLYKGHREEGILGSRKTPWEQTLSVIEQHPWFGSGFGTSITQDPASDGARKYATSSGTIREHGNSYLAIAEWVGLLGLMPFVALLLLVVKQAARVFSWLNRTHNPRHLAVPAAMILTAGLIHAVFEDWLFAVGYYLCVFFWALAFSLPDFLPEREAPVPVAASRPGIRLPFTAAMVRR